MQLFSERNAFHNGVTPPLSEHKSHFSYARLLEFVALKAKLEFVALKTKLSISVSAHQMRILYQTKILEPEQRCFLSHTPRHLYWNTEHLTQPPHLYPNRLLSIQHPPTELFICCAAMRENSDAHQQQEHSQTAFSPGGVAQGHICWLAYPALCLCNSIHASTIVFHFSNLLSTFKYFK